MQTSFIRSNHLQIEIVFNQFKMGKKHDIYSLFLWMDSSKFKIFQDIIANRKKLPKHRQVIIDELTKSKHSQE